MLLDDGVLGEKLGLSEHFMGSFVCVDKLYIRAPWANVKSFLQFGGNKLKKIENSVSSAKQKLQALEKQPRNSIFKPKCQNESFEAKIKLELTQPNQVGSKRIVWDQIRM